MGWIEDLHGQVVGLDTAPLIYYIERNPDYRDLVVPFFEAVDQGKIRIVTSIVTLIETLVGPLQKGNTRLADQYRNILFGTETLDTIMLTQEIAEEAAKLRALYEKEDKIGIADAIQAATAIDASASCFLTNDKKLRNQLQRASVIPVLMLDDLL